jgi:hypothetical protein
MTNLIGKQGSEAKLKKGLGPHVCSAQVEIWEIAGVVILLVSLFSSASIGEAQTKQPRQKKDAQSSNRAASGRITGVAVDPRTPNDPANKRPVAQPDLMIKQFLFPPNNDKALRVHVINQGAAAAGACRLVLTVRKINGAAVGRQTHVTIPALQPGKAVWLVIDAKSILPNNVTLESTTFKLNADATGIVAESDETNNEVWHNP